MRLRLFRKVLAGIAVLALVAVACGGEEPAQTPSPTGPTPEESPTEEAIQGGSLVLGAEQWPQCLNPITSCAFASWFFMTVGDHVIPRLMQLDTEGNFVASPVLAEAPTVENGGIQEDPFTITYNIHPDAVWDDGTPITSADIEFTWRAKLNTTGTISTAGYEDIESIDTSDPKRAVITFSSVYVDWPDLFGGGGTELFIKKDAFPEADPEEPDLAEEMTDSLPFSARPWKLQSWSDQEAVLVRNENFWGDQANLDQITFVPRQESATLINSLLSGEVSALYMQPTNTSVTDQLGGNPNVEAMGTPTPFYEAIWLNLGGSPDRQGDFGPGDNPFVDPAVREAFMYAIDRQAVIDGLIRLNVPDAEVLNCGATTTPGVGPWCEGNEVFEEFSYDPDRSKEILEGAGWDCSSTPCTRDGQELRVDWNTTAGNSRRETLQQLAAPTAEEAGFRLRVRNFEATDLFSNKLPQLDYYMATFAFGGSPDPSPTAIFHCDQIPTEENEFAGQNTSAWCNEQASQLMDQSDQALDQQQRLELIQQIHQAQAEDFVLLPMYQLPAVSGWRTDKVAGPVGDWSHTIYGIYFNLHEWHCAAEGACG